MNITDEASLKFSMAQILGLNDNQEVVEMRPTRYDVVVKTSYPEMSNTTTSIHTVKVN